MDDTIGKIQLHSIRYWWAPPLLCNINRRRQRIFRIVIRRQRSRFFTAWIMPNRLMNEHMCLNVKPGDIFRGLPMERKWNQRGILSKLEEVAEKEQRNKAQSFLQPGLGRRVRLGRDYVRTNSRVYGNEGTRCMLYYSILKQEKQSTTINGCQIWHVLLCSAASIKVNDPK